MEKITFSKLDEIMTEYNRRFPEKANSAELKGIIVYKQSNFDKPYTEEQRSYEVCNCNRRFQDGKISNALYGDCLDGKDVGVRLDWYNWSVEYCYMR